MISLRLRYKNLTANLVSDNLIVLLRSAGRLVERYHSEE